MPKYAGCFAKKKQNEKHEADKALVKNEIKLKLKARYTKELYIIN